MYRAILCSAVMLSVSGGCNAKTHSKAQDATISNVDADKDTVAVKMKSDGKDVERTFRRAENIEYMDSEGRVAAADIFTSGDMVLIVESEGTITKMQKKNKADIEKQPDRQGTSDTEAKSDKAFIQAADQIDLAEVTLGKVVEEHAASDAVKKFGKRAGHDHASMNKELREITTKKGLPIADALDQKHQRLIDDLSKLHGAAFDRAYTKDMVAGHQEAIEQFEGEAKNGQNSEVKAWAEKWLPTLREHLTLAREAVKEVKGSQ